MATVLHSAPRLASNEGVREALSAALGDMLLASKEEHGEIVLGVQRERIEDALRLLRDAHDYQQLMEIAGVDYPQPRGAVRGGLHAALADEEPPHPGQGPRGREHPGADRDHAVAGRRLARARSVRHVRRDLRRQHRLAPHPHRLRLRGPSLPQGLPAHRLPGAALLRGGEARGLRAGRAGAGLPQLRVHEPVGRRRLPAAGRREGRAGAGSARRWSRSRPPTSRSRPARARRPMPRRPRRSPPPRRPGRRIPGRASLRPRRSPRPSRRRPSRPRRARRRSRARARVRTRPRRPRPRPAPSLATSRKPRAKKTDGDGA